MLLNKLCCTPFFNLLQPTIDLQNDEVENNHQKQCIHQLREDHMGQIIRKLQPVSKQKQEEVYYKIVQKITGSDQHHRKLEVLREKKLSEKTVQISNVHKEQRIAAQYLCIKDIDQYTAQKADIHALLLSSHKTERCGYNDQKIWSHRQKRY